VIRAIDTDDERESAPAPGFDAGQRVLHHGGASRPHMKTPSGLQEDAGIGLSGKPQPVSLGTSHPHIEEVFDVTCPEYLVQVPTRGDDGGSNAGRTQLLEQRDRCGEGRDPVLPKVLEEVAVLAVAEAAYRLAFRRIGGLALRKGDAPRHQEASDAVVPRFAVDGPAVIVGGERAERSPGARDSIAKEPIEEPSPRVCVDPGGIGHDAVHVEDDGVDAVGADDDLSLGTHRSAGRSSSAVQGCEHYRRRRRASEALASWLAIQAGRSCALRPSFSEAFGPKPSNRPPSLLVDAPMKGVLTTEGRERAMTDDGDLRQRAIANLKKKRELAAHLPAYVLVNAFLVAIWAVTSDGTLFWPIFPILGWGIGLVFHAWDVYGSLPGEEQIHREMERLR
jgi:hypothetical protein